MIINKANKKFFFVMDIKYKNTFLFKKTLNMIGNILFQQFQLTKLYLILIFILLNKFLDNYHHKNMYS